MDSKNFFIASEREIKEAKASDVYFNRTAGLLEGYEIDVVAEFTSSVQEDWINFTGLQEIINILQGKAVDLWAIPEGSIISPKDSLSRNIPFIVIKGKYSEMMELETSMLGFICHSSGISTESSKVFIDSYPTPFISFGIRRMHPGISPMIDRAAYIGGAAGVSGILGAELLGISPSGTMPHSIALAMGEKAAWEYISKNFPKGQRTLLIDTFGDEKFKAIEAAEMFPDIDYIRLDTPSSRRGNMASIVREIRWELDIRGKQKIGIMVSGGLKKEQLPELRKAGANVFGVGTSISSARAIDFAMDIVEINGKPITKKGKLSGRKDVYVCDVCSKMEIGLWSQEKVCETHGKMHRKLEKYIENGKLLKAPESSQYLRERSVSKLKSLIKEIKE